MIDFEALKGKKAKLVCLDATVKSIDVELIECFRANVILFAQPEHVSSQAQMKIGQRFQVRFNENNITHSYHAKIVRFCNNSQLCLQLLIPGESQSDALTREPRIKVEKKEIKITLQDGKQKIPASIKDISVNGAQLVSSARLGNVNEVFNIELTINESASSIRLPCKIRYIRTEIESSSQVKKINFHHGVEFLHLADNAENFLLRFVS